MSDKSNPPLALVTGAARGIGLACAEAIKADGARLVLADIDEKGVKAAAEKLGDGTLGIACDVSEPDQISALFDQIEGQAGTVSILVNNAGIALPCDFLDVTLEDFRKVLDVNLTGSFYATQRAARNMVKEGIKGSIINMS